jgi:hypothetical protein
VGEGGRPIAGVKGEAFFGGAGEVKRGGVKGEGGGRGTDLWCPVRVRR